MTDANDDKTAEAMAPIHPPVDETTGVFVATYRILSEPKGPVLTVNLSVFSHDRKVLGTARLQNTSDPAFDDEMAIRGRYATGTNAQGNRCALIELDASALSVSQGRPSLPTLDLTLLTEDWTSGTADYRFSSDEVTWTSIKDARVDRER